MNVQQTDNKPSNEKKKPKKITKKNHPNQKQLKGLQTANLNMMGSHCAYHLLSDKASLLHISYKP